MLSLLDYIHEHLSYYVLFYYSISFMFLIWLSILFSWLKLLSRFYSEWYSDSLGPTGNKIYWNGYFANLVCVQHVSLFVVVYSLTDYTRKGTLLNLGICIIQILKFVCNFLWWKIWAKLHESRGVWKMKSVQMYSNILLPKINTSLENILMLLSKIYIFFFIIFVCLKYLTYFLGYLVLIFMHKLVLL